MYVSNRVSTILQATSPQTWRHVPTAENPADCASRGLMPKDLLIHSLWWDGPSWLLEDPILVPRQPPRKPLSTPEQRVVSCNVLQFTPPPMLETRYSSYHKLLSITAWCLRFYHRLKHTHPPDPGSNGRQLTSSELRQAEHLLVRLSQARSFPRERLALLQGHAISPSSKLISLSPFMDQEQLLRVGGRLSNSALTISQQHPLIVNSKDTLIHLLFTYMHVCLAHCGPSLLLSATGWRFHVMGARRLSRAVCSQCKVCRKAAPRPQPQFLGQLPEERITTTPAFHTTGLDFAVPFTLKKGHTRKPVYVKAYICVFICFSTRAIHIEVISDLTTSAFLAGMVRFVSRRNSIYSDNGSNFVGAKNQLRELYKFLRSKETDSAIHQHLLLHQVTWNTIPERAPHFGGLWESAVKSMKYHLKRVVGSQVLTYEELQTVTCQVEACLNSRPIMAKTSHDQDGISTLTSGHFLTLQPSSAYPSNPHLPEEPCLLKKWQMCQSMIQHFWNRWHKEYLQTLQARTKWRKVQPNLQPGDVVILKEDKTFTCHWPLAKIIQTYPGKDGIVRVAQIQTATSLLKRPVTKLALLHREEDSKGTSDSPSPRSMSRQEPEHCPTEPASPLSSAAGQQASS